MRISAVTTFKQGDIWVALKRLGWTQAELARRVDIRATTLCDIINMKHAPRNLEEILDKIQRCFAKEKIYIDVLGLWPKGFKGTKYRTVITTTKEIPVERFLEEKDKQKLIADGGKSVLDKLIDQEGEQDLMGLLPLLPFREREVIKLRWGLGEDGFIYTLEETARIFKVTRERIRQLENGAIRHLRDLHKERDALCNKTTTS